MTFPYQQQIYNNISSIYEAPSMAQMTSDRKMARAQKRRSFAAKTFSRLSCPRGASITPSPPPKQLSLLWCSLTTAEKRDPCHCFASPPPGSVRRLRPCMRSSTSLLSSTPPLPRPRLPHLPLSNSSHALQSRPFLAPVLP